MAKTFFTALISILAFALAPSAAPASAQETAGQVLAKLEKLSAENRQKVLVERAKTEKEVTFYSSLQTADAEPYVKTFNKRYPFIKVNIYRISGQKQVIMIQSELNAGRHAFDTTNASAAQAFGIKKTGALDPYQSPQRQYFSPAHKDKPRRSLAWPALRRRIPTGHLALPRQHPALPARHDLHRRLLETSPSLRVAPGDG
jgi:ABC-type glycerol-3-phosphate transport system substrate-binding protein